MSLNNRDLLVNGLLSRAPATLTLLTAIRDNNISATALSVAQRNRLRDHTDPRVRTLAARLFEESGGDRMRVYQQFQTVTGLPAAAEKGKQLFATQCGTCHRLEREEFNVGPDLFGIRNQDKEATLLHILVPHYEVLAGFTAYEIETTDGRSLSGLITSETESSVTLRMAQAIEETIRRADILSLRSSDLSLMPDGLEQTLSRQDLADLLAFLKGEL
ncbi:MAG: c-type cytochrome [Verrucomicrobia bacterium]|nr:c-type cytochrome [Verrucomicrobiota bacterium]